VIWLLALACNSDEPSTDKGDGTHSEEAVTGPTWHGDVAPIVADRCAGCHTAGGPAFDLTDPAVATAMASAMASAVAEGRMPPWGAQETDDCTPIRGWVGDRRLSEAQETTLAAWAAAGAPVGDPATAAPLDLAEADTLLGDVSDHAALGSYTTRGAADELVCLVVDPEAVTDLWVDGVEIVPSNRAIAHHTLVLLDPDGVSEGLMNEAGWYDCGGSGGIDNPSLLGTWVPGSGPTYTPEGAGIRIPAGSRIVLQMHYHAGGAIGEEDLPTLRLRHLPGPTERQFYSTLLGNFENEGDGLMPGPNDRGEAEFYIPANVADHYEEQRITFPDETPDLPIPMVGAHMHLVATSMKAWLERANPTGDEPATECILPASRYDYDWQQLYRFEGSLDEAPRLSGGDTLVIRCDYDNTLDNPGVARALEDAGLDAPVDVYLGEGTLDEMCIGIFSYVF